MTLTVPEITAELQKLQRMKTVVMKSRNMHTNRLQAVVAGTLGYSSSLSDKDRKSMFVEARAIIEQIASGEETDHPYCHIVRVSLDAIAPFQDLLDGYTSEAKALAKQLPVARWVEAPEQKGFDFGSLATVIGETGDLNEYANPGKVWRRLGCAPHSYDGKVAMGSTWRSGREGKLTAEEWQEYGYSPRRRSLIYNIGECLQKQNRPGPYRQRYDDAKAKMTREHEGDKAYPKMRCHLHGMLCCAKLLLRNLWREWTGRGVDWSANERVAPNRQLLAS